MKIFKKHNKEKHELTYDEMKKILGFEIEYSFFTPKYELEKYRYEILKILSKRKCSCI